MILLRSFLSGHIRIKRTLEYYDAGIGPRVPFGGGFGPTVSAIFATALGDYSTLSTLSSMPPGGSISRAGQAMLYDSTGKLTYAPNNLLLRSNNFVFYTGSTSDAWYPSTAPSIFASTTTAPAPDGSLTAYQLAFPSSSDFLIQDYSTNVASKTFIFSIWISAPVSTTCRIRITQSGGGSNTTTVSATTTWQRVYVSYTTDASATFVRANILPNSNAPTIYVWGAQLEAVTYQTSPSGTYYLNYPTPNTTAAYYGPRFDYDPATLQPKGLLIEGALQQLVNYTQDFSNAYWTKSATITPTYNAYTSPDGTVNASRFASTAQFDSVGRTIGSLTIGSSYTFSMWVRLVSGSSTLYLNIDEGGANANRVSFTATSSWQRVSVTRIITSGTATVSVQNREVTASTFECFGAQFELRSFPSSYIPAASSGSSPFSTRAAETFAITGYASNLIEAFYIDEATGGSWSANYNAGTAPSTSFGWTTSLRVYTNAYAGDIATPSWIDNSGTVGGRMVTDSTGTLTWAPENLLLNSATLSTQSVAVTSPTVTTGGQLGSNYILSFKGTGSVAISGTSLVFYTGSSTLAGTGASTRVSACFFAAQGTLTFTVSGTVTEAQLERVTYQTSPRAYIPTTAAAIYNPRYDYDASTVPATPRGMLIEESRANLCTYSQQFDNAAWNKSTASVTANAIASPDGTITADTITATSASGYVFPATSLFASAGGATYTYSVYAKAGTSNTMQLLVAAASFYSATYTFSTKTVSSISANASATMTDCGNGWYRLTLTCNSVANNAYTELQIGRLASGATIYLWGAQLEAGSFATSYIPTTTGAVTRVADIVKWTSAAQSSYFNAAAGTFGAQIVRNSSGGNNGAFEVPVSAGFNDMVFGDTVADYRYGSGAGADTIINTAFTSARVMAGYTASSFTKSVVINNGTVVTGTAGGAPTYTGAALNIGRANSGIWYLNGHLQSFAYYNQRLPDAILKQKSSVNAPY